MQEKIEKNAFCSIHSFSYSISIQCFSIASKQQNEATYIHYTLIRALFCETTML